jgi:hypothetical protein
MYILHILRQDPIAFSYMQQHCIKRSVLRSDQSSYGTAEAFRGLCRNLLIMRFQIKHLCHWLVQFHHGTTSPCSVSIAVSQNVGATYTIMTE